MGLKRGAIGWRSWFDDKIEVPIMARNCQETDFFTLKDRLWRMLFFVILF